MDSRRLRVRVCLLRDPSVCLWCWELVDPQGAAVESSWDHAWTAYGSHEQAHEAGLRRLPEVSCVAPRG